MFLERKHKRTGKTEPQRRGTKTNFLERQVEITQNRTPEARHDKKTHQNGTPKCNTKIALLNIGNAIFIVKSKEIVRDGISGTT